MPETLVGASLVHAANAGAARWVAVVFAVVLAAASCLGADEDGAADGGAADDGTVASATWRLVRGAETIGDLEVVRSADGSVLQQTRVWVLDGRASRLATVRTGWTPAGRGAGTLWRQGPDAPRVSVELAREPRWRLLRQVGHAEARRATLAAPTAICAPTVHRDEARLGDGLALHQTLDVSVPVLWSRCILVSLATEVPEETTHTRPGRTAPAAVMSWGRYSGGVALADVRGLVWSSDGVVVYVRAPRLASPPTYDSIHRAWVGDEHEAGASSSKHRMIWEVRAQQAPCAEPGQRQETRQIEGGWMVRVLREPRFPSGSAQSPTADGRSLPSSMLEALAAVRAAGSSRAERVDATMQRVRQQLRPSRTLGSPSLEQVWEARSGDCTEYAQATVALLRAAGVPSRVVVGWAGGAAGVVGWHAWIEFEDAGRWISADPTVGRRPAPVDRVCLAVGDDDVPAWWVPAGRMTPRNDAAWATATSPNGPTEDAGR